MSVTVICYVRPMCLFFVLFFSVIVSCVFGVF